MLRIPGSERFARLLLLRLAPLGGLLLLVAGCALPVDQTPVDPLSVFPSSAAQGMTLLVEFAAADLDLYRCEAAQAATENPAFSLSFSPLDASASSLEDEPDPGVTPVEPTAIHVLDTSVLNATRLRATLRVSGDANVGAYRASLQCGALTRQGRFTVAHRADWTALTVSPDTVFAGEQNTALSVRLDCDGADRFRAGQSRLAFGDNGVVLPFQLQVDEDGCGLSVRVNVSEYAVPHGASERWVPLTVITGDQVATGVIRVRPPHYAKMQLVPDGVLRPADDGATRQTTLLVTVENMRPFALPDPSEEPPGDGVPAPTDSDTDAVDEEALVLEVLDNPGVHVEAVRVLSEDSLAVDVAVDAAADVGPATLHLSRSGESAAAALAVLPAAESEGVRLYPPVIDSCEWSRCARQVVFFEAVSDTWQEDASVSLSGAAVTVHEVRRLSARTLVLWLTPERGTGPDHAVVRATTGDGKIAQALLRIRDTGGRRLRAIADVVQGAAGNATVLTMEKGTMNLVATLLLSPRQGIGFDRHFDFEIDDAAREKRGLLIENHHAMPDAPVGPASFQLFSGGNTYEAWYRVLPSGKVPALSVVPDVLHLETLEHTLVVTGQHGMDLASQVRWFLADPHWQITNVAWHEDDDAVHLKLRASPGATAGLLHIYAEGNDAKAAAAVRVVSHPAAWSIPGVWGRLERDKGVGTVLIPFSGAASHPPLSASLAAGIGARVDRVLSESVFGDRLRVTVSLAPEGPGGWTGLQINVDGRALLVPVEIVAIAEDGVPDDSLTMVIDGAPLVPGGVAQSASFAVPELLQHGDGDEGNLFHALLGDVVIPEPNLHVRLESLAANGLSGKARIALPWLAQSSFWERGIPLVVRTARGAHVGFLPFSHEDELPRQGYEIGKSAEFLFASETPVLATASFQPPITGVTRLVHLLGSSASLDYADLQAMWLASDYLTPLAQMRQGHLFMAVDGAVPLHLSASGHAFLSSTSLGTVGVSQWQEGACPHLFHVGRIASAQDVFETVLPAAEDCRYKAVVVARRLDPSPASTPDVRLQICGDGDDEEDCTLEVDDAPGALGDPEHYFDAAPEHVRLRVVPQLGTEGYFVLNLRGEAVIARVCRDPEQAHIALEMMPGADLGDWSLQRGHPDTGIPSGPALSLSGVVPANGWVIIAEAGQDDVTVIDTAGVSRFVGHEPFLLWLRKDGEVVDSLQVGGAFDLAGGHEGLPVENGIFTCFSRLPGNIDTNDNRFDFFGGWDCGR